MIQSIYASVSNADVVPCGKKGKPVSSEPIPLLRNKYLGEYRTELEKAKVRKNLGIADNVVLEWGNITGFIEDNADLKEAFSYKLPEHLKDIIKEDFTTVKGALNWAIEYISTFVTDTESIAWLREQVGNIQTNIDLIEESLDLDKNNILSLQESVEEINRAISKLDEDLSSINVNESILTWIKNASSNSILLTDNSKLEVKIADLENNALLVDELGLFVLDLSEDVSTAKGDIENLLSNVQTLLDNYVSKEDLGGNNFNFVNQEEYDEHVLLTNDKFSEIDTELDRTVKTGEDGHVDTLYVNKLSNQEGNIKIDKPLEVLSGVPLDIRTVVNSIEELYNISPDIAYNGMAVANVSDGNIYMLIDKSKISEKVGWKASYESLQIITCTLEEYEAMAANTDENYLPIKEGPFLYLNTYYYIYEDSIKNLEELAYVKYSQFALWQETLNNKASRKSLQSLDTTVTNLSNSLINNYSTTELIASNYASILYVNELLNLENPESFISSLINNYYNKDYIDSNFVTLEYLKGGGSEETGYIFVSQKQYNEDQNLLKEELQTTLKTEEDGSVKNLTVLAITSSLDTLAILTKELYIGTEKVALDSDVPIIEVLTKTDYDKKLENGEILDNVYYYTYSDEATDGVVTNSMLELGYYKKGEVTQLIYTLELRIIALEEIINNLQTATL